MSIDSNAVDGEVVSMPRDTRSTQSDTNQSLGTGIPSVEGMQLLSGNRGWVLSEGQFFWTESGGDTWENRTPAIDRDDQLVGGLFQDTGKGWLIAADAWGQVDVYATVDDGKTWNTGLLPVSVFQAPVRKATIGFIDSQNGWLSLELESSSNFSLGELFGTSDGGQTWEHRSLPTGEAPKFADTRTGWVQDSERNNRIYSTTDGGFTWEEASLQESSSNQALLADEAGLIHVPEGAVEISAGAPGEFWVLAREGNCSGEKDNPYTDTEEEQIPFSCLLTTHFLHTVDAGATWEEISLP